MNASLPALSLWQINRRCRYTVPNRLVMGPMTEAA